MVDFLEGTCGQAYNVCAQRGLESIVRSDGQNPFSATHTQCLDPVTGMRTVATNLIYIGATKSAQINESDEQSPQLTTDDIVNLPTSFDWRNYEGDNWTTPVRDQLQCGSCWAFSSIGMTESVLNIATDDPDLDLDLAEQHLVADCCLYCGSCKGGSSHKALGYIQNYGIPDEACFPYGDGDADGCRLDGDLCDPLSCTYCNDYECSDFRCDDACVDVNERLHYIDEYVSLGSEGYHRADETGTSRSWPYGCFNGYDWHIY